MAGPAAAPGVSRLFALEIPWDEIADRGAEDVIVWDAEGSKKGELADEDGVLETARGGRLGGINVELEREAKTVINVHGSDREIGLVVGIATCPILAHGHAARKVARLDTAVHSVSGRVQDVELAGGRISESGADHLIAAPADDQELVACGIGIDVHDVVGERNVEAGGGGNGCLHGNLLVQVPVRESSPHLRQGLRVHNVDESLNVHRSLLRWLGQGANVGQIQTVAANQRRQELVREHPLRVVRVYGVSSRQVWVRAEDKGVGWGDRAFSRRPCGWR